MNELTENLYNSGSEQTKNKVKIVSISIISVSWCICQVFKQEFYCNSVCPGNIQTQCGGISPIEVF